MFKISGVSTFNGEVKVRFANDMTRIKILDKGGHTDIVLIDLPHEMDKPEVVKYLLTTELMQTPAYAEAIEDANEKYSPKAKAAVLKTGSTKAAKVAKPKAAKTTTDNKKVDPAAKLAEIKARAAKKVASTETAE